MFPKLFLLLAAVTAASAAVIPRPISGLANREIFTDAPDTINPNVNCNTEDDDGSPLIASGVGDSDKQFSWCEYEGAGLCTYFAADGSFSSGNSVCPDGLVQDAATFGDGDVNLEKAADSTNDKVKIVVVTVTVPPSEATSTSSGAAAEETEHDEAPAPITDPALDPAPAPITDPALDPAPAQEKTTLVHVTDTALDPLLQARAEGYNGMGGYGPYGARLQEFSGVKAYSGSEADAQEGTSLASNADTGSARALVASPILVAMMAGAAALLL